MHVLSLKYSRFYASRIQEQKACCPLFDAMGLQTRQGRLPHSLASIPKQTCLGCSSDKVPSRQNSLLDARNSQGQAAIEETVKMSPFPRRHKSLTLHGNVNSVPMNAWSHLKENNSDAESTTSRSLPGSPSGSPTQLRKDMPRAQSLEFMSSDDGDKGDGRKNGRILSCNVYTSRCVAFPERYRLALR